MKLCGGGVATLGDLRRTHVCPAGHPLSLGLHDSARPVLPRPPTISNPPPLISSTKHPSVLDRQVGAFSPLRRGRGPSRAFGAQQPAPPRDVVSPP